MPKDAVFAEVLVFSNIFGFPTVNWAPIWTKTVNFNCIPFQQKLKIFEGFFKNCFSYLRLHLVKVSTRSNSVWGSKSPENPKNGLFHRCWVNTKQIWKFWKFHNHTCYTDETYHIYAESFHRSWINTKQIWKFLISRWNLPYTYLNKVFQLAKS